MPLNTSSFVATRSRLQIVATRGQIPIGLEGTTYTNMESVIAFQTGKEEVSGLRLMFANFYMRTSGLGEDTGSFDYGIEASVLTNNGGAAIPVTFNGQKNPTISSSAAYIISDAVAGLTFPANTTVLVRCAAHVALGTTVPGGLKIKNTTYDKMASSNASASQVYTSASFQTPAGGAVSNYGFAPVALLGIPKNSIPAVLIQGDSIAYGVSDTNDTFGQSGYIERGLYNVYPDGSPVPFTNLSVSGGALYMTGNSNAPRLPGIYPYATDIIFEYGVNDIASRTLAQMQADATSLWTVAKRAGLNVYHTLTTPFTDSGNTAVWSANFAVGGKRWQFNQWLRSQVGRGLLDDIINPNSVLESRTTYGLWANSAYTLDGIHPNPAGNIAAAPVIREWARAKL